MRKKIGQIGRIGLIGLIGHIGPIGPIGHIGPIRLIGPIRFIGPIGLITLIFLASCTAEVPQELEEQLERKPVTFMTYISQPVTRADSSLLAVAQIPGGQSIGIYGYYHDNSSWSSSSTPNFMFNQQATNNGLNQPFTYSPLKYWPNEKTDKVSFIAYYPYCNGAADDGTDNDIASTGISPRLANSGKGLPSFDFTVNDDVKMQVDFMVSDLIRNQQKNNNIGVNDRVRFNFRHATSKIEFRVVVDDDVRENLAYFTLKSISLTHIYKKATLKTIYTSASGTTSLSWSSHNTKTTYNCKTTEAYLLLPQTLSDDAMLTATYDLAFKSEGTTYTYDANGNPVPTEEYVFSNRTTSVQLNTLKASGTNNVINEWEPNQKYVYNLVIKPHRINFTGEVVAWGKDEPLDATMEN